MSKHITNYKPKDFAELLNVSVKTLQIFSCKIYGMRKYKKKIEEDEEIAKSIQNGNKSNREPKTKD